MTKDGGRHNQAASFLHALRASKGMTQEKFAEQIGVTSVHVANIEAGRFAIGRKTREGILSAFPEQEDKLTAALERDASRHAQKTARPATGRDEYHPEDELIYEQLTITYVMGKHRRPLYQLTEARVVAALANVFGLSPGYRYSGSSTPPQIQILPPHTLGVDLPVSAVGARRFNVNFSTTLDAGEGTWVRYLYFFPEDGDEPEPVLARGVFGRTESLTLRVEFDRTEIPRGCRQMVGFLGDYPNFGGPRADITIDDTAIAVARFSRTIVGQTYAIQWEW